MGHLLAEGQLYALETVVTADPGLQPAKLTCIITPWFLFESPWADMKMTFSHTYQMNDTRP